MELEDGVTLSLKDHVGRLIQEARNGHHLCRIFSGWVSYFFSGWEALNQQLFEKFSNPKFWQ